MDIFSLFFHEGGGIPLIKEWEQSVGGIADAATENFPSHYFVNLAILCSGCLGHFYLLEILEAQDVCLSISLCVSIQG
jgi:hypothetical protein